MENRGLPSRSAACRSYRGGPRSPRAAPTLVWVGLALARLSVTQAAVAQLSVPVMAALGAVLFLGERLSLRLVASGSVVLGGVAIVLSARSRR